MAIINGIIQSYDLVGITEDISDVITMISPTATPFQSSIGKEGIHNIVHQWQEDSLLAVAQNSAIEGASAPAAVAQNTVMRSNNTQILTATASASGTADKVQKYGRAKELAYQLGRRAAKIKLDLEYIMVGTGQTSVIGNDTTARLMAGAQALIGAGTTVNVGSSGAALLPLTEAAWLGLAQTMYNNGAEAKITMIKPNDALKIASWQSNPGRTEYVTNGNKTLYNTISVYVSPFSNDGTKFVLNRNLAVTDALVYDPTMWKVLTLRPWFRKTLAVVGDSTNVEIIGEFSLKHKNFGASGRLKFLAA